MESTELLEWLINEKNMSIRSAKDVISRCSRVRRMLHTDSISSNTLEILKNNDEFEESSMFIKSQLKRAVTLYNEFVKTPMKD